MSKDLDDLVLNCDHDVVVETGETDQESSEILGEPHYYLNCLICSTTLLRPESFYKRYRYSGIELQGGKMYHRLDFKNEYGDE